jgi:hypothetical protein
VVELRERRTGAREEVPLAGLAGRLSRA